MSGAPVGTTVVVVLYRTPHLDLTALPAGTPVVLVHNDGTPTAVRAGQAVVTHLRPGSNLGFGGGVNAALPQVRTTRTLLANPDVALTADQWATLLAPAAPDELVTVPQADATGTPASTVNRYPGPAVLLLQTCKVGRWAPRGSALRRVLSPLLGAYGTEHCARLAQAGDQRLPLSRYWASGSLLSVDTARLRAVGGFDEAYFLYVEDVDLCRRLAVAYPGTALVVRAGDRPALHHVGGSATSAAVRARVRHEQVRSAARYAATSPGTAWRLTRGALALVLLLPRPAR